MAKIVVTSTAETIQVDLGDYAPLFKFQKVVWRKSNVIRIALSWSAWSSSQFVEFVVNQGFRAWSVAAEETLNANTQILRVDSVDGVAPTDTADLYAKLSSLLE